MGFPWLLAIGFRFLYLFGDLLGEMWLPILAIKVDLAWLPVLLGFFDLY